MNISTITDTILMIRPANFGYNEETAKNNSFQSKEGAEQTESIKLKAIEEFDAMVKVLQEKGVEVLIMEDSQSPIKPDAIFPNNWFSCHVDGSLYTFPMHASNRRLERQIPIINKLKDDFGFNHHVFLEAFENQGKYLEGTGSMILDRIHKICYACLSPRTHEYVLDDFCARSAYKKVAFQSLDRAGGEVYHTNVMMALGENFVVICLDSIPEGDNKQNLINELESSGKHIIEISLEQMEQFAGNMLQIKNKARKPYLVMSQTAFDSLSEIQKNQIHHLTETLVIPIPTIEKYGGGSVRCMMAEVFAPRS